MSVCLFVFELLRLWIPLILGGNLPYIRRYRRSRTNFLVSVGLPVLSAPLLLLIFPTKGVFMDGVEQLRTYVSKPQLIFWLVV